MTAVGQARQDLALSHTERSNYQECGRRFLSEERQLKEVSAPLPLALTLLFLGDPKYP